MEEKKGESRREREKKRKAMRPAEGVMSSPRRLFSLVLVLAVVSSSSLLAVTTRAAAEAVDPRPQQLPSFQPKKHAAIQLNKEGKEPEGLNSGCTYTVQIKTSCSSPRYTRDMISLAFGDAYRNEVYAPRLDNPPAHAFERCSTDTYKIQGPCGYGTCYLYLQRNGWDGWTPDWVKVYEPYARRAITFYYGTPLPNGIWYGFNHCARARSIQSSVHTKEDGNLISGK